jgi:hypothetical protein
MGFNSAFKGLKTTESKIAYTIIYDFSTLAWTDERRAAVCSNTLGCVDV